MLRRLWHDERATIMAELALVSGLLLLVTVALTQWLPARPHGLLARENVAQSRAVAAMTAYDDPARTTAAFAAPSTRTCSGLVATPPTSSAQPGGPGRYLAWIHALGLDDQLPVAARGWLPTQTDEWSEDEVLSKVATCWPDPRRCYLAPGHVEIEIAANADRFVGLGGWPAQTLCLSEGGAATGVTGREAFWTRPAVLPLSSAAVRGLARDLRFYDSQRGDSTSIVPAASIVARNAFIDWRVLSLVDSP